MTEETTTEAPRREPPPGWNTEHLKDYRALRRVRRDRKLAGVAEGLGRHLDIDPTILRVLFVVLAFFGGSGILLYGALWLVVPEEETGQAVVSTTDSTRNGLLIAAGVVALVLALGETWTGFWLGWPLAVVGLVVAAVLITKDRSASKVTPAPPPYSSATPPPLPPRPRRNGPLLLGITLALVALALGVLGLFDASGAEVPDAAYPAMALGVIGTMLVVGAFWGRPGGLVGLGLVAALLLAAFSIGQPSFDGDRDLRFAPDRAVDVADAYQVPAGRIELDLTDMTDLEELEGRHITLEANAGELVVVVPDDLAVEYSADIEYGGNIDTPGGTVDGWGRSMQGRIGDGDAVAEVELELDLKFGHIEVREQ